MTRMLGRLQSILDCTWGGGDGGGGGTALGRNMFIISKIMQIYDTLRVLMLGGGGELTFPMDP